MEPELGHERADAILAGADELAADVILAVADRDGPGPPPDPVARLQDHDGMAKPGEFARGGQSRKSSADDDHVGGRAHDVTPSWPQCIIGTQIHGGH